MKRVLACALLAACGGSTADDDATPDAAPVPTTCDPATPFDAPHPIAGLMYGSGARLSPDELTIDYTDVTQSPGGIFEATRTSFSAPFGTPRLLIPDDLGVPLDPALTADRLTMYLAISSGDEKLYVTTRASTDDAFGTPVAIDSLDGTSTRVGGPFLASDESELWFDEGFDEDLYHATRDGDGFAPAIAATSLNETDRQLFPTLSADGLTIYFLRTSDQVTNSKVMIAHRASVDDEFGAPTQVPEVFVAGEQFAAPTWLSVDQCRLYLFAEVGQGPDLLYVAERSPS